jgi:outer membrane protein
LQKKYAPREQTLEQLNTQIETLKKQLQDGGASLSGAQRQTDLQEIDGKTRSLQRSADDLRNDEQSEGQETLRQVASKVGPVMVTYAEKEGIQLVLDSSQQTSGVLWWEPALDITRDVVDAYNAKSGVPAPSGVPSATTPGTPNH